MNVIVSKLYITLCVVQWTLVKVNSRERKKKFILTGVSCKQKLALLINIIYNTLKCMLTLRITLKSVIFVCTDACTIHIVSYGPFQS